LLAGLLGQIDGERVTLGIDAPTDPITLQGDKDPRSRFVLMPLRA
jgi:hypothetical protein